MSVTNENTGVNMNWQTRSPGIGSVSSGLVRGFAADYRRSLYAHKDYKEGCSYGTHQCVRNQARERT
mgnify:CR=1 FL=1